MRRRAPLFLLLPFLSTVMFAESDPTARKLSLTVDEYVNQVMAKGERAQTAFKNFENTSLNYKVSYRNSRFPKMFADSSLTKGKSEVDAVKTYSDSASGGLSLSQPFYLTGGKISANYNQNSNYSDSLGVQSRTRLNPSYSASFTQPLFIFVGNSDWRNWKRTEISYQIAKENYQKELQTIENDARVLYYDVILKKAQLEVEKVKYESSKRANGITKTLVEAGRLAGIELSRSDINLQKDSRRLKNAETDLRKSLNDALVNASIKMNEQINFTTTLTYSPLLIPLEDLIDYAFQHRPDYLSAKRQLDLSELSVKETEESNNPTVNAVASISKSNSLTSTSESTSRGWTGSLNLSWPFFDSRTTHLQVIVAKNNLENERNSFRQLERSIRAEITNAYLEVKRTEEQFDDLKVSREQAKQNVEAVRVRYQNGRDRLIDVFDSEQQLRDLELENLSLLISANTAKDRLSLLVGGPLSKVRK